jgi:2-polyprenyl-3-methyl-5-hydroxy-6-metoxy-1,4-benzoquinol methylase
MDEKDGQQRRVNLIEKAWDEYHPDYIGFALKERPDYFEFFRDGGVALDEWVVDLIGDVKGKKLLDICCASDATQAFSWTNLGALVTASDISGGAIELAKKVSLHHAT